MLEQITPIFSYLIMWCDTSAVRWDAGYRRQLQRTSVWKMDKSGGLKA